MPKTEPSLVEARDRAWYQWGADGIDTIITGLALLLSGLGGLWAHRHSGFSEFFGDLVRVLGLLFLCEEALVGIVVGRLKSHITYPRTGYVARPQAPISDLNLELLSSADQERLRKNKSLELWMIGPLVLFISGTLLPAQLTVLIVVWYALASLWLALLLWARRTPRKGVSYPWLILLLGCIVAAFWRAGFHEKMVIMTIAFGVLSTLTGMATLFLYLRTHPAPTA